MKVTLGFNWKQTLYSLIEDLANDNVSSNVCYVINLFSFAEIYLSIYLSIIHNTVPPNFSITNEFLPANHLYPGYLWCLGSTKMLTLKSENSGFERKMVSKIFKSSKKDLSWELFFSDFFNGTPLIFFQNLKALETSFSKLVLHAQKVHILREFCSIEVCQKF